MVINPRPPLSHLCRLPKEYFETICSINQPVASQTKPFVQVLAQGTKLNVKPNPIDLHDHCQMNARMATYNEVFVTALYVALGKIYNVVKNTSKVS